MRHMRKKSMMDGKTFSLSFTAEQNEKCLALASLRESVRPREGAALQDNSLMENSSRRCQYTPLVFEVFSWQLRNSLLLFSSRGFCYPCNHRSCQSLTKANQAFWGQALLALMGCSVPELIVVNGVNGMDGTVKWIGGWIRGIQRKQKETHCL